jgi:hypothetical protein
MSNLKAGGNNMKKTLSMVLAGLLLLVMASPLFAADIKVTGQVRFRYRNWNQITLDKDIDTQAAGSGFGERNYFDVRGRLGADAKLSEGVRVRLELENLQNFGSQNRITTGATSATDVFFRQAWMDFAVPGLPEGWRLQLGRSFFSLGHQWIWGNSIVGEDGATIYGPLGPGNLKVRFAQLGNNADAGVCCLGTSNGVGDNYAEAIDYKFEVAEKQNVEVYFFAQQDKGIGAITSTTKVDGSSITSSSEYWVGGAYSGVAGPVAIRFEGAYQGGTARADAAHPLTGLKTDIDRSAGFVWADATYKIIPEWSVGIDASFATGDGNPNDDTFNNFVGPAAGAGRGPTRVWTDSTFLMGNYTGRGIGNAATNRIYNLWGRGTIDVDRTGGGAGPCGAGRTTCANDAATAFSPGLLELKFKTKYAFNKQVTGFLEVIPAWAHKSPDTGVDVGDYIGTDIDLKVTYKPYPNIVSNLYFGYFIAGGFFDQGGALLAASSKAVVDDAYVFRAEVISTF